MKLWKYYFRDMIADFFWTDHFWSEPKRLIANNSSKQNHLIPTGKHRIFERDWLIWVTWLRSYAAYGMHMVCIHSNEVIIKNVQWRAWNRRESFVSSKLTLFARLSWATYFHMSTFNFSSSTTSVQLWKELDIFLIFVQSIHSINAKAYNNAVCQHNAATIWILIFPQRYKNSSSCET